ncbi:hypothetical protein CORC01_08437 [Colletotrichum orchidophilum]|uniref:Uncharacterized protein n=1 Tax=Colletotrichum orchidophilum TaxID=1209926 RepID=A0A1G4B470_9PEZI|nr:uncharacterized protein CORC01_08437 [Colletotrichum orchidophilum]OHE96219.1 hypothetical protein CORC01_08437 [Colletotrichum orchidophilum]
MTYIGGCIVSNNGTGWSNCTMPYIEARLKSQCDNLGGSTLRNMNSTTSHFDFVCECVHGNTKDFVYDDKIFNATATVGKKCRKR